MNLFLIVKLDAIKIPLVSTLHKNSQGRPWPWDHHIGLSIGLVHHVTSAELESEHHTHCRLREDKVMHLLLELESRHRMQPILKVLHQLELHLK